MGRLNEAKNKILSQPGKSCLFLRPNRLGLMDESYIDLYNQLQQDFNKHRGISVRIFSVQNELLAKQRTLSSVLF